MENGCRVVVLLPLEVHGPGESGGDPDVLDPAQHPGLLGAKEGVEEDLAVVGAVRGEREVDARGHIGRILNLNFKFRNLTVHFPIS